MLKVLITGTYHLRHHRFHTVRRSLVFASPNHRHHHRGYSISLVNHQRVLKPQNEYYLVSSSLGDSNNLIQRISKSQREYLVLWRRGLCSESSENKEEDGVKEEACSDEGEANKVEEEVEGNNNVTLEGVEDQKSSAMVSTKPRIEDHLTVIALPLPHRPLFPGFYMPILVKDSKLLKVLSENKERSMHYAGAFLVKDEPGRNASIVTGSETEKSIYDLKGRDLFDRLYKIGTLAQISNIQGEQVVLIGHRRLQITEMVSEDPLTVKVDHLKEIPYNKDDDKIKATSFEVIATLRDVLKTSVLWRDQMQTYSQVYLCAFRCGDSDP